MSELIGDKIKLVKSFKDFYEKNINFKKKLNIDFDSDVVEISKLTVYESKLDKVNVELNEKLNKLEDESIRL